MIWVGANDGMIHGIDARLELYPVSAHFSHYFWSLRPEAADALERAGAFTRRVAG